jgi:anti-sigma B factor antagonist
MTAADRLRTRIVQVEGARATVYTAGEIDITSAPTLRTALTQCLAEGCTELTVDMTDLEFIDSSGLGVLVWALKQLRTREGRLIVCNAPAIAQKVLGISGLSPYLDIVSREPEPEPEPQPEVEAEAEVRGEP